MHNDAKLGLILGIGLVVVIGMVFFRTDPASSSPNTPPTTSVNAPQDSTGSSEPTPDPLIN